MMNKRNGIYQRIGVVLTAVAAAAMLWGCGKEQAETAAPVEQTLPDQTIAAVVETTAPALPVLTVNSVTEQEDVVVVETSYCRLQYPFAFADLIQVRAVNEGADVALEFVMPLSGEEYPLFAVSFGGSEGILMGTIALEGEAEPVKVYAQIHSADESTLGDSANTYFAVQESFNDVAMSLMENENFTAAQ